MLKVNGEGMRLVKNSGPDDWGGVHKRRRTGPYDDIAEGRSLSRAPFCGALWSQQATRWLSNVPSPLPTESLPRSTTGYTTKRGVRGEMRASRGLLLPTLSTTHSARLAGE